MIAVMLCIATSYTEDPEIKPGDRVFPRDSCGISQYFERDTGICPKIRPRSLSSTSFPSNHSEWLLHASYTTHTHYETEYLISSWATNFIQWVSSQRGYNCSHWYISNTKQHSICVLCSTYTGNVIDGPRDKNTRTMSPLGGQGGWNPDQQFRRISDF